MEIENNVFGKKSPEKTSPETYRSTCVLKQEVIESEPNAWKFGNMWMKYISNDVHQLKK